ncbi:MAG: M14 family metallopeptidase [Gemmatimonadota bacterium]|nr:M14 family metallopeptidase [Gemmatimonadota bacterium]
MSVRKPRSSRVIRIGGKDIRPGTRTQIDLPITDLSIHVPLTMPVHVVNGRRDGPRLFVGAALHGDEINGVEVIRRVVKLSAMNRLRGALVAVPIVNVPGFLSLSRYLPDRRDLNRSFPGLTRGSLAARLAKLFLEEIVEGSTHGIDLHTGAVHRTNFPQVRANLEDAEAERIAQAFGVPLMINAGFRDGSLREAAHERGIPVIAYEAGEALRFDEAGIRAGVKGIMRVMRELGMLPPLRSAAPAHEPLIVRSTRWVRAPGSGVVRIIRSVGVRVKAGQILAIIADPLGETEIEIKAPSDGVVIGRTNLPLVHEGDALFNIGLTAGTQVEARTLDDFDPFEEYESGATGELASEEPQIV